MNRSSSKAATAGAQPPPAPPPERPVGKLHAIGVGAAVLFVFMVLMYGPNPAVQMIVMAVICTAGIGLIPILFVSWVVGWLVIVSWSTIRRPGRAGVT